MSEELKSSVAPGLERAIQIVREVAKTQPGYSDEREAIFEALSEAYVEAMAPPCTSADAVSVPRELLLECVSQLEAAGAWELPGKLSALLAQSE